MIELPRGHYLSHLSPHYFQLAHQLILLALERLPLLFDQPEAPLARPLAPFGGRNFDVDRCRHQAYL